MTKLRNTTYEWADQATKRHDIRVGLMAKLRNDVNDIRLGLMTKLRNDVYDMRLGLMTELRNNVYDIRLGLMTELRNDVYEIRLGLMTKLRNNVYDIRLGLITKLRNDTYDIRHTGGLDDHATKLDDYERTYMTHEWTWIKLRHDVRDIELGLACWTWPNTAKRTEDYRILCSRH